MVNALLPLDNFVVINKCILTEQDRYTLVSLYQPIVGSIAINLYLTLWSYLSDISSKGNSHNDLVAMMQVSLNDIKEAREKLEAIGLIKTYYKKGDINSYIYILYNPLSCYEFINNPILNTALYNNLSKNEYKRIIESFSLPKIDLTGYTDISLSFKDVYNFVSTDKNIDPNIKKTNHLDLSFEPNISFNEILSLIPEEMLNIRSITKSIKELIYKLSFIYNLNDSEVSEIIKNSIVDRKIDIELFKNNCRELYKFENSGKIPKLVYQYQPLYLRQEKVDNTRESMLINQFETTTPQEFLELKQNSKPTENDLLIVEDLILNKGLNPGVVNVLIDYALKRNNNKLVKKYVEQIAVQWKRSNITSVSEAINFARKEYDNKKTKKEIAPSWINKKFEDEELLTDEQLAELEKELGVK